VQQLRGWEAQKCLQNAPGCEHDAVTHAQACQCASLNAYKTAEHTRTHPAKSHATIPAPSLVMSCVCSAVS
jgi:hypothetical protein